MRPILPTPTIVTTPRSIVLPDGQQFFHDKLANIAQAAAVLTLNLTGVTTAITYTAASTAAASLLSQAIAAAVSSGVGQSVEFEEATSSGTATISGVLPSPIVSNTVQTVTISGTGFLTVASPVITLYYSGSYEVNLTSVVIVDDTTITAETPLLPAGSPDLALLDGTTWISYINVTVT